MGAHPSQIWRAIIDGRDIMKQGIIRRIWTGEDTMIWEHNWIPRDAIPRPIVSLVHDPPTRVHELIEQTTTTWKEDLVRSVFVPIDVEAILKIPLCTRRVDDFWAWSREKRGMFTVCSTYRMNQCTKLSRENWLYGTEGPSTVEESSSWTSLWNTQVPNKICVFLWWLARESIPTYDILHHRNMATSSACQMCGRRTPGDSSCSTVQWRGAYGP